MACTVMLLYVHGNGVQQSRVQRAQEPSSEDLYACNAVPCSVHRALVCSDIILMDGM